MASTTTLTHSLVATGYSPASEPGALDGGFARCSCGWVRTHSLGERWAAKEIIAHAAYMNAKAR